MNFGRLNLYHRILLYRHPVNMNKSIDGLCAIALAELDVDPCSKTLFVFVNRSRDKIKMLLWENNGFWIFYKRLESQRFAWPDWFDEDSLSLTSELLDQLVSGFNVNGMRPHKRLEFSFHL